MIAVHLSYNLATDNNVSCAETHWTQSVANHDGNANSASYAMCPCQRLVLLRHVPAASLGTALCRQIFEGNSSCTLPMQPQKLMSRLERTMTSGAERSCSRHGASTHSVGHIPTEWDGYMPISLGVGQTTSLTLQNCTRHAS